MDYGEQDREDSEMNQAPGQDAGNTPEFQLVLRTTDGDHVIAASDTVNDLVDQAKYWMNVTDTAAEKNPAAGRDGAG